MTTLEFLGIAAAVAFVGFVGYQFGYKRFRSGKKSGAGKASGAKKPR